MFLRILVLLLISAYTCNLFAKSEQAVLDLENWDGLEILVLDGQWNFYWDQYLTFTNEGEPQLNSSILIPTNKNWGLLNDSLFWKPFGKGVYHLKVINCHIHELAIRTEMFYSTSYRMFIDDSLIGSLGNTGFSGDFEPEINKKIFFLNVKSDSFDIYIETANYIFGKSGPLSQISMGKAEVVSQNSLSKLIFEIAAISITLAIAFRSLVLFFLDRSRKAHLSLFFLLFLSSLRCILIGEVPIKIIWPEISFLTHNILRSLSFILGLAAAFHFVRNILPNNMSLKPYFIFEGALIVCALIVSFTPIWTHTVFSIIAQLIIVFGLAYTICDWIKIAKMDKSIYLLIIGAIVFTIVFVHDTLAAKQLIPFRFIQHYGVLIFAIFYSIYLNLYFIQRSNKLSSISKDIQEIGVITKNKELFNSEVVANLKDFRKKLKDKNEQNDLDLILKRINDESFWTDKQSNAIVNFSEVGDNFVEILNKNFPNLTSGEVELCVLIKAKLSTKEIAVVRNITTDSAKSARKRLRRKLKITPEVNLSEFIDALN